jgi:hypothetical protein
VGAKSPLEGVLMAVKVLEEWTWRP